MVVARNHFKIITYSRVIYLMYLRFHGTRSTGRVTAGQPITRTVVYRTKWHCITAVDCTSFLLPLDDKKHLLWARWPDDRALAICPAAWSFRTLEPSHRFRSMGRSQNNCVTADNGRTVAFRKKNTQKNEQVTSEKIDLKIDSISQKMYSIS